MNPEFQKLGDQLREARIARQLTLVQLAALSGVSKNHIAAAEKGGNVTVRVLSKLAPHLGLKILDANNANLDVAQDRLATIGWLVRGAIKDLTTVLAHVQPSEAPAPNDNFEKLARRAQQQFADLVDFVKGQPESRQSEMLEAIEHTMSRLVTADQAPILETATSRPSVSANAGEVREEARMSGMAIGPDDRDRVQHVDDRNVESKHQRSRNPNR